MRTSQLYAPTLREVPAEAEVISHKLMLRAGMIRKAAGGLYTYLPLAWRTIKKIEQIIREEMDAAGGQEIAMPIVQPSELWKETGRWEVYGDEMFRVNDRHGREFCLGPTHEEMVTSIVRDEVRSYKQLPLMLYQIQNKYRDEIRPRFGLMRGREFIMKDLYSFDKDEEGMRVSYKKMYDAYTNVFTRCGLTFRPVEADNGAIGGGGSHEFTVLADAGESSIAYCEKCDYAASDEKAELKTIHAAQEEMLPLEKVATPGTKTIALVADYLKVPVEKTIKAVAYQSEKDEVVLAFVRGDHEQDRRRGVPAHGREPRQGHRGLQRGLRLDGSVGHVLHLPLARQYERRDAVHDCPCCLFRRVLRTFLASYSTGRVEPAEEAFEHVEHGGDGMGGYPEPGAAAASGDYQLARVLVAGIRAHLAVKPNAGVKHDDLRFQWLRAAAHSAPILASISSAASLFS